MTLPIAFSVVLALWLAAPASGQFVKGDIYVGAWPDHIYHVDASFNVTTFADANDGLHGVSAVAFTPSDTLLASSYDFSQVFEFDAGGNGSVLYDSGSGLKGPFGENGLIYDLNENLYVSDFDLKQIFEFPAGGGAPSVFADSGDGVWRPDGLAFVSNGDMLVANRDGKNVLRIDPSGNTTIFDTLPESPYSIVVRGNGDVYVATYPSETVLRYPGGVASMRQQFVSMTNAHGNPSLQIGMDDKTLYFTSYGVGNLVVIDADTGSTNEVLPKGSMPGSQSIAVYGSLRWASWTNYGSGFPGRIGVPAFTARKRPIIGTTTTFDLDNSHALPTVGVIFVGLARIDLPTSWGGDLLVDPSWSFPVKFSIGGVSFDWDVPNDPSLIGLTIDLQTLEADSWAAKGVSFTPGLELFLGTWN